MTIRYSSRAIGDLAEIADYLIARSPRGAQSVEAAIHRTIEVIASFPGAGRTLRQRPTVRVVPVGRYPYLVFYTARTDEIMILHVRHGARRPVNPGNI